MHMKRILIWTLLAALILAGCSKSSVTFRSEAGGFTVTAPAALKEQPQSMDTSGGKIDSHTFAVERKNITYVAAYTDFQEEIVNNSDPQTLLNNARDSIVASLAGFLLRENSVSTDNYPGRELSVAYTMSNGKTGVMTARIYMVKTRLYHVMAMSSDADYKDPSITRFLDSFKLTGKP